MELLARFILSYPGSSFPTQARLESGRVCIVKMHGSGNGPSSLLAEFIVNRLASSIGLPVPDAFPVQIPLGFPWEFGTDEFDDIVQRSYGSNLGIVLIPDSQRLEPEAYPLLDHQMRAAMKAIDLLFLNLDRQPKSQNILREPSGKLWLIDHGSCLFLRSLQEPRPLSEEKDPIFTAVAPLVSALSEPQLLANVIAQCPAPWLAEGELTRQTVQEIILRRAQFLLNGL